MVSDLSAFLALNPAQVYEAGRAVVKVRSGDGVTSQRVGGPDGLPRGFRRGTPDEFKAMLMGARVL